MIPTLRSIVQIIRPVNLVIMGLTQLAVSVCLGHSAITPDLAIVILITLLSGAAGYVINDYHDVLTDRLNKPYRVVIDQLMSRRQAIFIYVLFNTAALVLSMIISMRVALATLACQALLWSYSARFKKVAITGNLMVSLITAVVLFYPSFIIDNLGAGMILPYAIFAFMSSMIRELIKDCEDIEGDRETGCHTFPVVHGIPKSLQLIRMMTVFFLSLLLLFIAAADLLTEFYTIDEPNLLRIHLFLLAFIPGLGILIQSRRSASLNFSVLSRWCKWMMLGGMTSMLWFL